MVLSLFLMGEKLKKSDCTRIISLEEMELIYQAYLDKSDASQCNDLDFNSQASTNATKYFALINSIQLQQKIYNFFSELKDAYLWYVITDVVSIDAAYSLPIMNALASSADNIQLLILPLDDNKNVALRFLKSATESIPQLICVKKTSDEIVFVWRPRSELLQHQINEMQTSNNLNDDNNSSIERYYETDAGQSVQQEIYEKFKQAINNKSIIQDIYQ